MNTKLAEHSAPTQEHRTNSPAIPLWNAGNDNQDPYQEPGFLIRNSFGV